MSKRRVFQWFISCLAVMFVLPLAPVIAASNQIERGTMAGYQIVPNDKVPETYNGGFSLYVAAWPLLEEYPGNRFQTAHCLGLTPVCRKRWREGVVTSSRGNGVSGGADRTSVVVGVGVCPD